MSPMEIALLVIGVIIFVISFIMPEVPMKKSDREIAAEKEEARRLVEQEVDTMRLRVGEARLLHRQIGFLALVVCVGTVAQCFLLYPQDRHIAQSQRGDLPITSGQVSRM